MQPSLNLNFKNEAIVTVSLLRMPCKWSYIVLHSVTDLLRFRKINHQLALRVSKRPAPKVFGIR
jgi:hypothetical protein